MNSSLPSYDLQRLFHNIHTTPTTKVKWKWKQLDHCSIKRHISAIVFIGNKPLTCSGEWGRKLDHRRGGIQRCVNRQRQDELQQQQQHHDRLTSCCCLGGGGGAIILKTSKTTSTRATPTTSSARPTPNNNEYILADAERRKNDHAGASSTWAK